MVIINVVNYLRKWLSLNFKVGYGDTNRNGWPFKNFDAATDTINGIEAYAMLRKNQSTLSKISGRKVSIADQFYAIAA